MTHSLLNSRLSKIIQSENFRKKSANHKRMILLAEKIFGRRKDLDLSQKELAKKTGTTQRIISELENASYAPANGIGIELHDKLAEALEIDRDYLLSDKIDRRTFELYSYIGSKLDWNWDIMQFMKLPYFIDLEAVNKLGFQISNLKYIRHNYGPFDKNMYIYWNIFENSRFNLKFSYINDFIDLIDQTLDNLPVKNGDKLKEPLQRVSH